MRYEGSAFLNTASRVVAVKIALAQASRSSSLARTNCSAAHSGNTPKRYSSCFSSNLHSPLAIPILSTLEMYRIFSFSSIVSSSCQTFLFNHSGSCISQLITLNKLITRCLSQCRVWQPGTPAYGDIPAQKNHKFSKILLYSLFPRAVVTIVRALHTFLFISTPSHQLSCSIAATIRHQPQSL